VFTGVLRGERLAETYAGMDLFAFPSNTDTFGNVVLEALASGVPVVVTDQGGPKFLVQSGRTGRVAASEQDFISAVNDILTNPAVLAEMGAAAREYAVRQSWDSVFESVFAAYGQCGQAAVPLPGGRGPVVHPLLSSRMHERGRP
jgi:glycosyltransferase involved in cell wall biosynthesis